MSDGSTRPVRILSDQHITDDNIREEPTPQETRRETRGRCMMEIMSHVKNGMSNEEILESNAASELRNMNYSESLIIQNIESARLFTYVDFPIVSMHDSHSGSRTQIIELQRRMVKALGEVRNNVDDIKKYLHLALNPEDITRVFNNPDNRSVLMLEDKIPKWVRKDPYNVNILLYGGTSNIRSNYEQPVFNIEENRLLTKIEKIVMDREGVKYSTTTPPRINTMTEGHRITHSLSSIFDPELVDFESNEVGDLFEPETLVVPYKTVYGCYFAKTTIKKIITFGVGENSNYSEEDLEAIMDLTGYTIEEILKVSTYKRLSVIVFNDVELFDPVSANIAIGRYKLKTYELLETINARLSKEQTYEEISNINLMYTGFSGTFESILKDPKYSAVPYYFYGESYRHNNMEGIEITTIHYLVDRIDHISDLNMWRFESKRHSKGFVEHKPAIAVGTVYF